MSFKYKICEGVDGVTIENTKLGCIGKGTDISAAHKHLKELESPILEKMKELGTLESTLESSEDASKAIGPLTKLFFEYLIRLGFSTLTFLSLGIIIFASIKYGLERGSEKIGMFLNPTPEKKVERIDRFRKKLDTAKPYIKELKKAWNE